MLSPQEVELLAKDLSVNAENLKKSYYIAQGISQGLGGRVQSITPKFIFIQCTDADGFDTILPIAIG